MQLLYPFARRFIAGPDLKTAIPSIHKISESGYFSSIDILGESVTTRKQAEEAKIDYLKLFESLDSIHHSFDFSIKLSQLGLDIDREFCLENLMQLAQALGNHTIRLDMEDSARTQSTLDICLEAHRTHPYIGQAIQAYLYRSGDDVRHCIENKISLRLCKGAYKESPDVAYQAMDKIRKNFLKLACQLLKEGHQPAIATHDESLLVKILDFIAHENISPKSFYFEMLYGVRRDLQKILKEKGYRVRVYIPYGKAWLPYTLRRLVEKKENLLFVITHLFRETLGLRKLQQ
ncbi:MAG: proline dehydrogenase [Nitrospina sp.]|jgi:proline dehydrogenase|nr:proline dehydrogenase [Nitrospina sp.]MBT5632576.1 proline dehydrogenase [Nitrospina sp.]